MDDEVTDTDKIKPFDKLFVIEGRQVFDFVKSTILKQIQPMCQINAHNTSVFQLPDTGDYLCVIDDSVMDQAAQITDLLAPWLEKARHIYSFKFQPAYLYNTDEQFDKECFVRTVPSSADNFGLDFIAPMEDCNIVHGVSAGGLFARHCLPVDFSLFAIGFPVNVASRTIRSVHMEPHPQATVRLLCRLHELHPSRFVRWREGAQIVYPPGLEMRHIVCAQNRQL